MVTGCVHDWRSKTINELYWSSYLSNHTTCATQYVAGLINLLT